MTPETMAKLQALNNVKIQQQKPTVKAIAADIIKQVNSISIEEKQRLYIDELKNEIAELKEKLQNCNNEKSKAIAQIKINEEKQGIEIIFENKPPIDILHGLKTSGFFWSNRQSLWYAKQSNHNANNYVTELKRLGLAN